MSYSVSELLQYNRADPLFFNFNIDNISLFSPEVSFHCSDSEPVLQSMFVNSVVRAGFSRASIKALTFDTKSIKHLPILIEKAIRSVGRCHELFINIIITFLPSICTAALQLF